MRATEYKLRDMLEVTQEGPDKGKKVMFAYQVSRGLVAVRFFNGRETVLTTCEVKKVDE